MTSEEIIDKVNQLKKYNKKIISNSYILFSEYSNKKWKTECSEKSLIIINNKNSIDRILFFTVDVMDLQRMLSEVSGGVLEIVTKDRKLLADVLYSAGFKLLYTFVRVSNSDVSTCISSWRIGSDADDREEDLVENKIGDYAEISDADAIAKILNNTFDDRASHLQNREEILDGIANKEYFLIKDSKNEIVSLIQSVIYPKTYYCNQIINKGNTDDFHRACRYILTHYAEQGGKYAYAWVDENNISSLRFFNKYSMNPDGLYNVIYVRE